MAIQLSFKFESVGVLVDIVAQDSEMASAIAPVIQAVTKYANTQKAVADLQSILKQITDSTALLEEQDKKQNK